MTPDLPAPSSGLGSRALRNTILVLSAKVVARLVALVTVLAMIKYFKAAPYGAFATVVNYTAIVSVVLDLMIHVINRVLSRIDLFVQLIHLRFEFSQDSLLFFFLRLIVGNAILERFFLSV